MQQLFQAKQLNNLIETDISSHLTGATAPIVQILLHAQMAKQARFLKDITNFTFVYSSRYVFGLILPNVAAYDQTASRILLQPRDTAQQRSLTRT